MAQAKIEQVFVPDGKKIKEEVTDPLSDLATEALRHAPCELVLMNPKSRSCLNKAQCKERGMREIQWGRPLTPREYDYLCPACRAYWHVLAAINDLVEYVKRSEW